MVRVPFHNATKISPLESMKPVSDSTRDNPLPAGPNLVVQGLIWNTFFQVFLVSANFASMLILVRILSPAEFGKAAATAGFLALINCFNCGQFISHAIQIPPGSEPDWNSHWSFGLRIQFVLGVLCNAVAGALWLFPDYMEIAPLLHLASIGLFLDVPSQMAVAILRREMNFRVMRIIQGICTVVVVFISIGMATIGLGAYALIVSGNIFYGIPFGIYLLFVRKWRPQENWWHKPNLEVYRPSFHFGTQVVASAVLAALRGFVDSLLLPGVVGYQALGLLNRAQVLFATTVGRVSTLIVDTIYPLLPRSADNPDRFRRNANLFFGTLLLISVPGAVFICFEGPTLSRFLYGQKWIEADPLILPATLFAWAFATGQFAAIVFQAGNRIREAFISNLLATSFIVPAIIALFLLRTAIGYLWALALGQMVAVIILMVRLSQGKTAVDSWSILKGPACVAAVGAVYLTAAKLVLDGTTIVTQIGLDVLGYGIFSLIILRAFFAGQLREIVCRLPGNSRFLKLLRL